MSKRRRDKQQPALPAGIPDKTAPEYIAWVLQQVPKTHPHEWDPVDLDTYENEFMLGMPMENWTSLDDAIFGRTCPIEDCPQPHSTWVPAGESDALVLLDKGSDMTAEDWEEYNKLLDKFKYRAQEEYGGGKPVEGVVVYEGDDSADWPDWETDDDAEWIAAWNTAYENGDILPNGDRKDDGKGKNSGPKKGDPCNCLGPGHPNQKWGEHIKSCPQHDEFDPTKKYDSGKWGKNWKSCKHERGKLFSLNKGLKIGAVAYRDCKYLDDKEVDIGVYLYDSWAGGIMTSPGLSVPWANTLMTQQVLLDWPDFSTPNDLIPMVEVVDWMLGQISEGKKMETACMGGHGRTGTMLALLLCAQGVYPATAIDRVRKQYCEEAIENSKQIDYIADFYKEYHGNEDWMNTPAHRKKFNKLVGSKQKYTTNKGSGTGYKIFPPWSCVFDVGLNLWVATGYHKDFSWNKELSKWTAEKGQYTPPAGATHP